MMRVVLIIFVVCLIILFFYCINTNDFENSSTNENFDYIATQPTINNFVYFATLTESVYNLTDKKKVSDNMDNSIVTNSDIKNNSTDIAKKFNSTSNLDKNTVSLIYGSENLAWINYYRSVFGVIGVASDDPTTAIIAFRGTLTNINWTANIDATTEKLNQILNTDNDVLVHSGFIKLFALFSPLKSDNNCPCLEPCRASIFHDLKHRCKVSETCQAKQKNSITGVYSDSCNNEKDKPIDSMNIQILNWLNSNKNIKNVVIAGHSLGGALATLAAVYVKATLDLNVSVYTYSSPKVGNEKFAEFYKKLGLDTSSFRFFNTNDLVPKVPPGKNWIHVGIPYCLDYVPDVNTLKSCGYSSNSPLTREDYWHLINSGYLGLCGSGNTEVYQKWVDVITNNKICLL